MQNNFCSDREGWKELKTQPIKRTTKTMTMTVYDGQKAYCHWKWKQNERDGDSKYDFWRLKSSKEIEGAGFMTFMGAKFLGFILRLTFPFPIGRK